MLLSLPIALALSLFTLTQAGLPKSSSIAAEDAEWLNNNDDSTILQGAPNSHAGERCWGRLQMCRKGLACLGHKCVDASF
jgi:hypothetical protein